MATKVFDLASKMNVIPNERSYNDVDSRMVRERL